MFNPCFLTDGDFLEKYSDPLLKSKYEYLKY